MINKITNNISPLGEIDKINEVIDQVNTNTTDISGKQATLVSGTNIKTINNISLLGSGNIDIQGGGANQDLSNLTNVGNNRLHALKGYEDAGELLTDTEGLADVNYYAHSTFDRSKFTVVGSPTITDDGILTGTPNAYLTSTISGLSSATKYTIKIEYTPLRVDTWGWVLYPYNHTGLGVLQESGIVYLCDITHATSFTRIANVNLTLNAKTIFEITVDETSYNFKATINSTEQSSSGTFTNAFTNNILWVGNYPSDTTNGCAKGLIDLKQFSITIDGVAVFSGNKTGIDTYTISGSTVSVPYTLSKTGSKIVDSYYRTQVANVYNYQGYAPYYTLSDTDFTLPQGELYGIMVDKSTPHIIETYVNGTSWYRIWSADSTGKKWCEQGGITPNITSSGNASITLLKPYTNLDYTAIACSNGAYFASTEANDTVVKASTSSITISNGSHIAAPFSWKTSGYIN